MLKPKRAFARLIHNFLQYSIISLFNTLLFHLVRFMNEVCTKERIILKILFRSHVIDVDSKIETP